MPREITADALPPGEYAIVEILGHRTLIGRVSEIERFGTKLLQVEQLFADWLLDPVLLGGSSIYQFTPCPARVAWDRRPKYEYALPDSVSALVPAAFRDEPTARPAFLGVDLAVEIGDYEDDGKEDQAREAGL